MIDDMLALGVLILAALWSVTAAHAERVVLTPIVRPPRGVAQPPSSPVCALRIFDLPDGVTSEHRIADATWIGSDPGCGIRLIGAGVEPWHALLSPLLGGAVEVMSNGVYTRVAVAGDRIAAQPQGGRSGDRHIALPGEDITIGSYLLLVLDDMTGAAQGQQRLEESR